MVPHRLPRRVVHRRDVQRQVLLRGRRLPRPHHRDGRRGDQGPGQAPQGGLGHRGLGVLSLI